MHWSRREGVRQWRWRWMIDRSDVELRTMQRVERLENLQKQSGNLMAANFLPASDRKSVSRLGSLPLLQLLRRDQKKAIDDKAASWSQRYVASTRQTVTRMHFWHCFEFLVQYPFHPFVASISVPIGKKKSTLSLRRHILQKESAIVTLMLLILYARRPSAGLCILSRPCVLFWATSFKHMCRGSWTFEFTTRKPASRAVSLMGQKVTVLLVLLSP